METIACLFNARGHSITMWTRLRRVESPHLVMYVLKHYIRYVKRPQLFTRNVIHKTNDTKY